MEDKHFQEYKLLVNEVTKGMEQVKQLKASSSTNQEQVLGKMLSSYEEALSILNGSGSGQQCESVESSVASDTSVAEESVLLHKRRNVFSRVTIATSGLADDGYAWRKYGQKNMLGATYPRSYYRCIHRVQGCLATKQVQRSDDNSSMYNVTYIGKHSCSGIQPAAPKAPVETQMQLIRPKPFPPKE